MYEEKTKGFNINWKSLIIKMAILLVALFIVVWLIAIVKKDDKNSMISNISTNLQAMQEAAQDYFKGSRLPEAVNGKKKITLQEMFDEKLLVEFRDQNNNACNTTDSFAEATKINDKNYTIKVKLVCGGESDYVINTLTIDDDTTIADNKPNTDNNITDNNGSTTDNNNPSTPVTKPSTPNTNVTTKPNTTKPNTSTNKPSNSTTVSKPNNTVTKPSTTTKPNTGTSTPKPTIKTCTYGDKSYVSLYPLAYVIPGDCAISKSDYYTSSYANQASTIGAREYQALNYEIDALKAKTGASLYVEAPIYSGIYNTANTGIVGYQIMFVVKQKLTYSSKVIYEYYLDQNGNRKVVIDNRSSLNASNNNTNVGITNPSGNNKPSTPNQGTTTKPDINTSVVTGVTLNKTYLEIEVGNTGNLTATIKGTNVSTKKVTWSSSNPSVATVDSNGVITAIREGSTSIIASVDGKSSMAQVKVNERKYLRLDVTTVAIDIQNTYKPYFETNIDNITWTSSNPNVATVDSTGTVRGISAGTAIITATYGTIKMNYTVNVAPQESVKFYDSGIQLMPGFTKYLPVEINNPYNKPIVYTSYNPSVVKVDKGYITALKPGTALITVSIGNITDSIVVTVY